MQRLADAVVSPEYGKVVEVPRSVSVAIRTVFLLPEEEGIVLSAPRGDSLCRDITNFAIMPYHTRQGRSPGTLPSLGATNPHE